MASSAATPAKGAQSSNPFSKFPNEIILDISQKLDPQDRAAFAASSRLIDTVVGDKRFLDDVRGGESAVVRLAAKTGNVEILRRLQRLIKDFDWNVRPATDPNIKDVQLQDVDWVEPIGTTEKGWTPLHIAAAFGNENVINYLWEQGISIDTVDMTSPVEFTPLFYAAHTVHASYILPILQDYGADIDLPVSHLAEPAIAYVAKRSRFKTALALLRAGANPMWKDTQGKNLLHICCKADDAGADDLALYHLVKELLARGVDATEQDHTGFAPLHYAVSKQHGGHNLSIILLVKAGANWADRNGDRETAFALLCRAAYTSLGASSMLQYLPVLWDIEINQMDTAGTTCLYSALEDALGGYSPHSLSVALTLLLHGTDPGDLFDRFLRRVGSDRICLLLTSFGSTDHYSLDHMKNLIFEARESGNQGFERRALRACPREFEEDFFHWYDDHFETQRDTLREQRESRVPFSGAWGYQISPVTR
ncbi:hypothetical protein DL767_009610 [Monosporascus sp. MG133]|nr:hypothetical protein DL767_009610 [Monosporascus sp. MG133]